MDKDYNIDINIQTKYSQVEQLNRVLEQTSQQLKKLSAGRINTDLRKTITKSADPIKEAQKQLNLAVKAYEKAQDKYRTLLMGGESIKNAKEISGLGGAEQNLASVIKTIEHTKKLKELNQSYAKLEQFMLALDPAKKKLAELMAKMQEAKGAFIQLDMAGESTKGAEKQIAKIAKQMEKLQNASKQSSSWIGKLMGRIRNISIYRMIRSGIRWLTSGVSEGLKGLAEYSGDVNDTLSNLKNSLGQIRNTLAISFASVLQTLEPIITKLSDLLVDLVNSFNLAMAKMQGKNVYTKAKKAADDYSKSAEKARKLSFDTFEVLSGGDEKSPTKDLFEEGNIAEDTNKLSETLFTVLKTIKDIAGVVGTLIKQVVDAGILDNLMDIMSNIVIAIGQIISTLVTSGAMKTILEVIGEITTVAGTLLGFFASIVSALSEMGALKPIIYGLVAAWAAYKAIMVAVTIATWAKTSADIAQKSVATWGAFAIAGAAIVGAAVGATAAIISKVNGYETGGIPDKSELFYMNENGVPEALVNTGGSQTNVINIDQLSEGMRRGFIQAIYDTNLLDTIRDNGNTTIMVDRDVLGQTVASSAGFRNEANRRNANLNFR